MSGQIFFNKKWLAKYPYRGRYFSFVAQLEQVRNARVKTGAQSFVGNFYAESVAHHKRGPHFQNKGRQEKSKHSSIVRLVIIVAKRLHTTQLIFLINYD